MNRRSFLGGATTFAMMSGCRMGSLSSCSRRDPRLVALVCDLHINGKTPEHSTAESTKTLAEILALDPLPARLICLGDVSRDAGTEADYRAARQLFAPVFAAGIEVFWTMGNHDHRATFARVFPEAETASSVRGRFAQVVALPDFDCVIVDSLDERLAEGVSNPVDGKVDEEQVRWLEDFARRTTRPFLVMAHHDGRQMKSFAKRAMASSPLMRGYIHGHRHTWMKDTLHSWGEPWPFVRSVGLPSAGFWGDIGYALLRDEGDRATVRLCERDCWYPKPNLPRGKAALRESIVRANQDDVVVFE